MGISSLGLGSSILTQDVIDQLRAADEAGQVTPVELSIANEGDKKDALALLDATMQNLADSISELATPLLYDERAVDVSGTSVSATADSSTDVQDFTLNVVNLATKQIEESGIFGASTDLVASDAGDMKLAIDGEEFTISYEATTTLSELKDLINESAGEKVNATIVQINSGEYQLFVSSVDTGDTQDIVMSDTTGNLLDTRLTTQMSALQTGIDANFEFNGVATTRSSNMVDDLIVGLEVTLESVGSSEVSVTQNRDNLMEKIDSFVEKYNAAMNELNNMVKPSVDAEERGIFSAESTVRGMKKDIQDMINNVSGGVGSFYEYGFDIDKDGVMSIDKDTLNDKLDTNSSNVEAFFGGGTYTNDDGSTVELTGAFVGFETEVEAYTKYNATLDQLSTSITDRLSTLEDKKITVTERLDAKYEILAKQFAAYDSIISRLNSTSSMFTEMANANAAAAAG